ncbi:MAG: alpha/beta hydrolase [Ferruginibacter sp.]
MTHNRSIAFRNTDIHYKITGKGLPVVLVHGFAEDSDVWDRQVEFLKHNYLLIIPDLPGSGRSGIINDQKVGMEVYADCIRSILEAENINRCIMIGHSMGGYITLAFAEKYSESMAAFGLFHSSSYADDAAKIETRQKAIDFIRKSGSEAFLKTSIPGLFYEQGNSGEADSLIEKGKAFAAEALIQYYEAMITRPNRTAILKKASVPILFIIGKHDKAVMPGHSLEQSHIPHRSHIHVLRNSAHMGMLEETDKANEILANFLESLSPNTNTRQHF